MFLNFCLSTVYKLYAFDASWLQFIIFLFDNILSRCIHSQFLVKIYMVSLSLGHETVQAQLDLFL
jgi:hypothetical protein